MRNLTYLLLACLLICCKPKGKFYSTNDEDIKIQSIALPSSSGQQIYQVRIFPSGKWRENGNKELGKKMQYEVDSSFYIVKNQTNYYPESITPIANGMSTNFEYLLTFSTIPTENSKDMVLVYHDKYMSQKDYKLQLN